MGKEDCELVPFQGNSQVFHAEVQLSWHAIKLTIQSKQTDYFPEREESNDSWEQ